MYNEEQLKEACKKAFEQGGITADIESGLYYGPECGIFLTAEEREEEEKEIIEFEEWFQSIDKEYLVTIQPEEDNAPFLEG